MMLVACVADELRCIECIERVVVEECMNNYDKECDMNLLAVQRKGKQTVICFCHQVYNSLEKK